MTAALSNQDASRIAHELFGFREHASAFPGYQTITLKEDVVLNGDTHIPQNSKLYVELAPARS